MNRLFLNSILKYEYKYHKKTIVAAACLVVLLVGGLFWSATEQWRHPEKDIDLVHLVVQVIHK